MRQTAILVSLAAIGLHFSAAASPAQDANPAAGQTVAVIGDVQHPNAYPYTASRTLAQTVSAAQPASQQAIVTILRSGQSSTQWSQRLDLTSPDTREQLMPGDVVIVQSPELQASVQPNAAVRTPSGVQVVALADNSVVVGDILQGLGLSLTEHVSLSAGFQGRSPMNPVRLSERVRHGDLITLGPAEQKSLSGFGTVRPTFSEWKSPTTDSFSETTSAPESADGSAPASSAPIESPAPPELPPELSSIDPSTLLIPPSAMESTQTISDEVDPASGNTIIRPVSQQTSEATATAPEPPPEANITPDPIEAAPAQAGEMRTMNVIVIGGLMLAGLLILAGSLRADDSVPNTAMRQSIIAEPEASMSPSASPAIQNATGVNTREDLESRAEVVIQKSSEHLIEKSFPRMERMKPAVANSMPLVKNSEWLGGDWLSGHAASGSEDIQQNSDSGRTMSGSEAQKQGPAFLLQKEVEQAILPVIDQNSVPEEQVMNRPAAEAHDKSLIDLEDLIQNRLPIDLHEAQLPLRISLFGKPAGPRRLRIDAAHAPIRTPHAKFSADRRRNGSLNERIPVAAQDSEQGVFGQALDSIRERTDS